MQLIYSYTTDLFMWLFCFEQYGSSCLKLLTVFGPAHAPIHGVNQMHMFIINAGSAIPFTMLAV